MHEGRRSPNKLIIVCGLSFAGKSTLAEAICDAYGYLQVDVDVTKDELFGPGVDDEDLRPGAWAEIYTETDDRIVAHLRNGDSLVDASRNFRQAERDRARALADRVGVEIVLVYVDTPEAVVRQRWAENRDKKTRRDVSDRAFEEIISVMEPPSAGEKALVYHHDDCIERWLGEHTEDLAWEQDESTDRPDRTRLRQDRDRPHRSGSSEALP
jgi:predicted kinase